MPTIFMPDALPGTTVPIYPGLGQAPNMLACILHIADLVILLVTNETIVSDQSSYFISGWLDTGCQW